jgi:hypothetical protein
VSWEALNLASSEFATRSEPPRWCDLIYAGKRHLLSGPPEAAKTLLAWIIGLNAIRSGTKVAALDFEMGPEMTRLLLLDLGGTLDEIRSIYYVQPDSPPTEGAQRRRRRNAHDRPRRQERRCTRQVLDRQRTQGRRGRRSPSRT